MNAPKIAKALRLLAEAIEETSKESEPVAEELAPIRLDEVAKRRCLEAMRRKGMRV